MNTPGYSNPQTSHPSSGNNSGRGKNVDAPFHPTFSSSFEAAELENNPKAKLYELFVLIEKEFESLYAENCVLRSRLTESNNKLASESTLTCAENNSTIPGNVSGNLNAEVDYKSYGKKVQLGQKWKTAFRGSHGRLVTSLKVGSSNPDALKHSYVQHFRGHSDGIWHVTAASIGSCHIIASASADRTSKIWLANDAHCVGNYVGHLGSVNSVAIRNTVDAEHILLLTTSGDRQSHIWKININNFGISSGNPNMSADDNESISTIPAIDLRDDDAPNNSSGACTGESTKISTNIQLIQHPTLRLLGHNDVVISGEWMYGDEQLITASWDRTANVYDAETGKIINTLSGHNQELTHCSAHSSQKLVATASKDFTFRLWDFRESIQSVAVFQGHNDAVTSVAFTATHHIASASDDLTTKLWDLRNMRSPMSTVRLNSAVNTISVCHRPNLIAIPQDGRHVSVYDIHGMRLSRLPRASGKCHHRMVCCASWLPENNTNNLITCGFDKQIVGWKFQFPHKS